MKRREHAPINRRTISKENLSERLYSADSERNSIQQCRFNVLGKLYKVKHDFALLVEKLTSSRAKNES